MRRGAVPTSIVLALVPEPKTTQNRLHLDLRSDDAGRELDLITGLGGRLLATHDDHHVLADPEGNEFCVLSARAQ